MNDYLLLILAGLLLALLVWRLSDKRSRRSDRLDAGKHEQPHANADLNDEGQTLDEVKTGLIQDKNFFESERKALEKAAHLEAERLAVEEAARIEAERKAVEKTARIEAERRAVAAARVEAKRKAVEEATRAEAERKAVEEAARVEAERKAVEEAGRVEAERKAVEEAARVEAERKAVEEAARVEAERKAVEEAARVEAERKAVEEAARVEAERKAVEEAARAEAERRALEEVARIESERKIAAEAARLETERKAAEVAARIKTIAPSTPITPKAPEQTIVMIVDDSKVVRIKTSRLLAKHLFQVAAAEDGLDAARQIGDCMPDVLITDVEMPGMDGFELTRHIRDNQHTAHIPIIMITSNSEQLGNSATEAGVNVVLGKPYPEEELISHIQRLMVQRV